MIENEKQTQTHNFEIRERILSVDAHCLFSSNAQNNEVQIIKTVPNSVLTGEVNLVPQCSNLPEKQELGQQSRRNRHLVCKEGYRVLQLASTAYTS